MATSPQSRPGSSGNRDMLQAAREGKQADGGSKKQPQRAQQKRTFHFFVRILDAEGNPVHGAKLHVDRVISDARKVIEFMDTPEYQELGLTRIKHEMVASKRSDGSETVTDGSTQVG